MTVFEWVQGIIVGIVVIASTLHIARKLMPGWMRSKQVMLANALTQPARPAFIRRLGIVLQPGATSGGGCGSGCNTCSTCESNPQQQSETKPLEFRRHI